MKISITNDLIERLKGINKKGQFPTISVAKSGCAGTKLVLKILETDKESEKLKVEGIDIAVSRDVFHLTDDISITGNGELSNEFVVINNKAKKTCRCGQSFKV
ncbi:MAG: hypothetical protein LBI26_01555 [Holosporales bacterium]|jgi:Fe-S cluster assembly iron-binding protein IscA|nr:hypothetical protein [Holosporales bacterium]